MSIEQIRQKYEDALGKRASAGFIGSHEAQQWIVAIHNDRMSVKRESELWGLPIKDILEISLKVFQRHYLYFEVTYD